MLISSPTARANMVARELHTEGRHEDAEIAGNSSWKFDMIATATAWTVAACYGVYSLVAPLLPSF